MRRVLARSLARFSTRCLPLLALPVLLLPAGCGIGEYEKRMGEFQKRLQYPDDENANLGDPLRLPDRLPDTEKKVEGEPEKVVSGDVFFLRPPRGISSTADDKPVGTLLHYPGGKDSGFDDLLLAVREKGDRKEFERAVLKDLRVHDTPQPKTLPLPDGNTLTCDYCQDEVANQSVRVFFPSPAPYLVAIVFRLPADSSRGSNQEDRIRFSLASLRTGEEAGARRRSFKPAQPSGPPMRRGMPPRGKG